MGFQVTTKNGEQFSAGFGGLDPGLMKLGDLPPIGKLPPISIEQFSTFAAETLVKNIRNLTEEQRALCQRLVEEARIKIAAFDRQAIPVDGKPAGGLGPIGAFALKLDHSVSAIEKNETAEALPTNATDNLGSMVEPYSENPFVFVDDAIVVGNTYPIEPEEFIVFVGNYLGGGHSGWNEALGVPQGVEEAITQLEAAFGA